ncbi:aspartate--tRNA ligase [Polymorphobacter fuscus]|uniref:Aspartate--tRNA(Asp/Asn) ligase n=1 Tax=Sandarakinorhabdus fusca TaxID=1439888 RepID=A0A7C9GQ71_9SPHN|nr:aspartate--tRNA ligase [Polymorphobacter fuscus]KAB7648709.1 aspartate--tRNA ligase [Polymorphobacter fuscus]MQT16271.1 aspartate--tRNA ligase [Polymorphobacter fuscus]NJC07444.1 aspartyl-tRNA synthetase [Polymorphobacter fuscus]
MHAYRTHNCGALRAHDAGSSVRLSGWIHRKRDHGGVLFIDLRDHFGLTQIVVGPGSPAFETLDRARLESVVTITGDAVAREGGAVNANLATGDIEVRAQTVTIQSAATELPLPVAGDAEYPEDIRLKYRFLDLRRERLHANMMLRSNVIASLRRRMIDQGFTEFQTPILTASSPEGARDYLVPSRVHPGKFYALPQAPQMFKQLLMVAGFDRYFQIAPCFRDEDARADRSPGEFYQLDFEMSFVTQDDVFAAIEPVLAGVFEENAGFGGRTPWAVTQGAFPRIPYAESMLKYGNDKPDLRNPLVIQDVTEHFRGSGFGLFAKMVEAGNVVRAIPSPGTAEKSRKFFDDMNDWARAEGYAGLGYVTRKGGEFGGPIAKNHGEAGIQAVYDQLGLGPDDGCFFAAGKEPQAAKLAGLARTRVGQELGLIEQNVFKFCWIVDFPMFEYDEDAKKIDFSHNPFSMPQGELEALETQDPLTIKAYQYDIVCNGVELSSGAIRNHRPEIMYKAFEIAGYSAADVDANFSGMINAFKFGAPPHGGSAPGVDRMVMLIADEPNIREVVVFPMNQKAEDLMMNAPAPATMKQLRELHIRTVD